MAVREIKDMGASVLARLKKQARETKINYQTRTVITRLEGFKEPNIYTYSLESTMAEKFDAILKRMTASSRMKDFMIFTTGRRCLILKAGCCRKQFLRHYSIEELHMREIAWDK